MITNYTTITKENLDLLTVWTSLAAYVNIISSTQYKQKIEYFKYQVEHKKKKKNKKRIEWRLYKSHIPKTVLNNKLLKVNKYNLQNIIKLKGVSGSNWKDTPKTKMKEEQSSWWNLHSVHMVNLPSLRT